MCNGLMNFMKCACIGLLAGTAVGAIFCCKAKEERKDRSVKRKAKKALAAMEDMMCKIYSKKSEKQINALKMPSKGWHFCNIIKINTY